MTQTWKPKKQHVYAPDGTRILDIEDIDRLILAILADPQVGNGTGSIAELWLNEPVQENVLEVFAEEEIFTKRDAIEYARKYLGCMACNIEPWNVPWSDWAVTERQYEAVRAWTAGHCQPAT
jgi:hypothetical protein